MAGTVEQGEKNILYQSSFAEGIWRSLNNGATWAQIKPPLNPADSADRATFALNAPSNGTTRMYVGDGGQSDSPPNRARFYRTDDAAGAAAFTDMTTPQNIGYCTSQCWYDNVATDFAVWKLPSGGTSWSLAAGGMPMVEVAGLSIHSGARALYAATHGLGGWKLNLP